MLLDMDAGPAAALHAAAVALLLVIGPVLAATLAAGCAAVLLQTGGLVHGGALMPDLARLNPQRGVRRVFGLDGAAETLKSCAKAAVLGWAVWQALRDGVPDAMAALSWHPAPCWTIWPPKCSTCCWWSSAARPPSPSPTWPGSVTGSRPVCA